MRRARSVHSLFDVVSNAWTAKRNGRSGAAAIGSPKRGRGRFDASTLLHYGSSNSRMCTRQGGRTMGAEDGAVRHWTVEDHDNPRFEDEHIDPYVNLRRISADPAIRQVTF